MPQRLLKAFVVEDDPVLCRAFADTLKGDGHITAVEAHDLPDAVRLCRQEPQPVILVDLGLPSAAGTDAVTALRRELPGATLVVITGAADKEDAAIRAGAHAVIAKGSAESYGRGLIDAVRRAVVAHDVRLLFQPAKEGLERQEELLKRASKVLGPVIIVVGLLAWFGAFGRADAAAAMRRDGEASALAWWAAEGQR